MTATLTSAVDHPVVNLAIETMADEIRAAETAYTVAAGGAAHAAEVAARAAHAETVAYVELQSARAVAVAVVEVAEAEAKAILSRERLEAVRTKAKADVEAVRGLTVPSAPVNRITTPEPLPEPSAPVEMPTDAPPVAVEPSTNGKPHGPAKAAPKGRKTKK